VTATDLIQYATMIICFLTVVVWFAVGSLNVRLVWLRWPVIIPSGLTAVFYLVVLLTDFKELYPSLAAFISALIRFYTQMLFFTGGLVMLVTIYKKRHHE
jgi:hypothetical protein